MQSKLCSRTNKKTSGFTADHILLKGETVEQCKARKAHAVATAERLVVAAHHPDIAEYWRRVQDMAFHELARLEELTC